MQAYLLKIFPALDRYEFMCRVQQFIDESLPSGSDEFFRIQIIGRIPTSHDQVKTDVQVEVWDVTEGRSHPQQVLSADEQYRCGQNAEFHSVKDNGVVPKKFSVLAVWTTVAQFPCQILRFAQRGRRKLMFCITVVDAESGREIIAAQEFAEYVYCNDGYREMHARRRDVSRSCVELAAFSLGTASSFSSDIKALWSEWIRQKSDIGMSVEEAAKMVGMIERAVSGLTAKKSSETLKAYGESADGFLAMELALETAALSGTVTAEIFNRLSQVAETLGIRNDRFLAAAQKILLASECRIQEPSCLLGIAPEMDEQSFRKRLTEEYRKWNARVTHPDPQVRQQADQVLTLIADIRTHRLQSCS
ncbi:MAG: hypothetical protein ABFR90_07085 [Planctomycetota bacterium]